MYVDYIYCPYCGYEDNFVFVAYSRTTAEDDLYICPECKAETSHVVVDQ
jgi:DNA-directed RNA polymerase subunit RPC12/RpoP